MQRLQQIELLYSIPTPPTLITLLRSCPELSYLVIQGVRFEEDAPPEIGATILESLAGLGKRHITIQFNNEPDDDEMRSIWESEAVRQVVKRLEESEGLVITLYLVANYYDMFKGDGDMETDSSEDEAMD